MRTYQKPSLSETALFYTTSFVEDPSLQQQRQQQRQQDFTDEQLNEQDHKTTSASSAPSHSTNPFTLEFHNKISKFASYSDEDIALVLDPRRRALYEGVAASAMEPAVRRAFQVLFEDLAPIRLAGRTVFGQLAHKMDHAIQRRNERMEELMERGGMDKNNMMMMEEEEARRGVLAYEALCWKEDYLTMKALKEETDVMQVLAGSMSVDDFARQITTHKRNRIELQDLLGAIKQSTNCDDATAINLLERAAAARKTPDRMDRKRLKNTKRYAEMVEAFKEWETYVPTNEGRMYDVLRGCFVGARNPKVVKALEIVYVDYAPLRLAGDIIFKLMSALIRPKTRA